MNKRSRNEVLATINGRTPSSKPYTGRLERSVKDLCSQVTHLLEDRRKLRVAVGQYLKGVEAMEGLIGGLNPAAKRELRELVGSGCCDDE